MTDDELEKLAEQFGEWMGGERINDIPHYRLVVTNTAGFARAVAARAAQEEREACAKQCDEAMAFACSAAIRARGAGG